MTTSLSASSKCWLFCCAAFAAAVAFPPMGRGQEFVEIAGRTAADSSSSKKITVHLWVVEVDTDKLRNLGFGWSQMNSRGEAKTRSVATVADLADASGTSDASHSLVFKGLEQNNLGRMIAEPTIATLSGRKASLTIGDHLQLDVTPTAIDDKNVQLQYRVEVGAAGGEAAGTTSAPLLAGSTVQVEVGRPCLVSQTRSSWQMADGKRRQTETLLLVRADFLTANAAAK
jgi:hypothetical protein